MAYQNFNYNYDPVKKNRLLSITNSVNNTTSNYQYDEIGNVTKDELEGNATMDWNVYGKLSRVVKTTGSRIDFKYDASGNRIAKIIGRKEQWSVRDAGGNIMATYLKDPSINSGKLSSEAYYMYGSSMLGAWKHITDVESATPVPVIRTFVRGEQEFYFSNQLGNNVLILSDKKTGFDDNGDGTADRYEADVLNATDYSAYGENLIGREFKSSLIQFGFNSKWNDTETGYQDYGMRMYSGRKRGFVSVDPLMKSYPFYSPYQFAGNMPIAAIDLDGKEVKTSFDYGTVTKDRTAIEVGSSSSIKIQVINLSAHANDEIDLQNIAINLSSDLSNKLSGNNTSIMNLPFIFKSQGNKVTNVDMAKSKKDFKEYSVTFKTTIYPDISVVDDISKINKDAWVFAIVDDINNQKDLSTAGLADVGGKVAIAEAKYFIGNSAYKEGRQLILHEELHLMGATDTYPPHSALPGTNNNTNVMYNITPDNKRKLTSDQIVQEVMTTIVGGIYQLFSNKTYEQPEDTRTKTPTQQELKTFIKNNGSAAKINNP